MTEIKIETPDGEEKTEILDVPGAQTDKDAEQLDKAVGDIVRQESDEALEAEDARTEQLNATVGDFRPWYQRTWFILVLIIVVLVAVALFVPNLHQRIVNDLHSKHF